MNFDFSEDQNLLRVSLRKYLGKESPLGLSREVIDKQGSHAEAVWRGLTEQGVTALMLPDDCDGIGLGAMELCVAAEEIGRQLSPVPLASTLYLAAQAVMLGSSQAPRGVSNSRYDRPKVSPVNTPRLRSSHTQWWWRAWPGVSSSLSGRPARSISKPSALSSTRPAGTGSTVPIERCTSSAP